MNLDVIKLFIYQRRVNATPHTSTTDKHATIRRLCSKPVVPALAVSNEDVTMVLYPCCTLLCGQKKVKQDPLSICLYMQRTRRARRRPESRRRRTQLTGYFHPIRRVYSLARVDAGRLPADMGHHLRLRDHYDSRRITGRLPPADKPSSPSFPTDGLHGGNLCTDRSLPASGR